MDDRELGEVLASEDRYRKLISNMPIALWQVDAREPGRLFDQLRSEGVGDIVGYLNSHPQVIADAEQSVRVTDVSSFATTLFGATDKAQMLGPVRYLFAATPGSAARVMRAHFEGQRNYIEEMRVATFDGRLLDVIFQVTYPQPPEQLDTTLITVLDITERLRTLEQLRQLQAAFAHAARVSSLGVLVASISHEVKQPLAAIITNAESSLRWLGRSPPNLEKIGELIRRIGAGAHHANDVVERVQGMAEKRRPAKALLQLNEVVDEAMSLVTQEADRMGISIDFEPGPAMPDVDGDRVQLQQVVVNLLVNAMQAMSAHWRPRRIDLKTSTGPSDVVELIVHDSGPGIPDAHLANIFGRFFSTKNSGMGMGLTICETIVTEHGGSIDAGNDPQGGARFRVFLPGHAG